jgi:hypothetical protein
MVAGPVSSRQGLHDLRRAMAVRMAVCTAVSSPNSGCGDQWRVTALFAQLADLIRSRLPSGSRSSSSHLYKISTPFPCDIHLAAVSISSS